MCGILGIVHSSDDRWSIERFSILLDQMYRRGPSGHGTYFNESVSMGMRRLSIIDIEGGDQPFFSKNGGVVAFQNGEIYNHRDLRSQLVAKGYAFKSASDTEVLSHGFAEWGIEGLLDRLDGMFAIAVLDKSARKLYLARDRFGEKPLFYTVGPGCFAYSSMTLPLCALSWVDSSVSPLALNRYLALHYCPGEQTIFKGIRRVLPGEYLEIDLDRPEPKRHSYYRLPAGRNVKRSRADLGQLIESSVASRLQSDVPVGVFLSGGLDSSIVASVAAKYHPGISTFSIGFGSKQHDESSYAEELAGAIGSQHRTLRFDQNSFSSMLPKVIEALDEPVGDQALVPLYWLSEQASEHCTVVLSGEAADEIFAGYGYYGFALTQRSMMSKIRNLLGKSPSGMTTFGSLIENEVPTTPSGFPLLLDKAQRDSLLTRSKVDLRDEWERTLIEGVNSSSDALHRATMSDISTWLVDDLLVKFDRMTMAHSIEGRAPFLQKDIVEYGCQLPQTERMTKNESKVYLRKVAREWIPERILNRKKQGFVLPMKVWLREWLEHHPIDRYSSLCADLGLEYGALSNLLQQELRQGVERERMTFAVVVLLEWYSSFRDREARLIGELAKAAK